jgi:hypothetical protein
VADVLRVAAFQLGDPVAGRVLMKSDHAAERAHLDEKLPTTQ